MSGTSALQHCTLCPFECGVDRTAGQTGRCGAGTSARVARAALHFWEEPCLSGVNGSGTVFFSHCPLGCVFCQNRAISRDGKGTDISNERLGEIFCELQQQGAHNLNLVTPTHFVPQILDALDRARENGFCLPVVYNCGGYERPETIALLADAVDVFLPDFKYADPRAATRYSAAPDYPARVLDALDTMLAQTGPPVLNSDGLLTRGVLVRHLMLPGLLADSMHIVETLWDRYGDSILLSLMNQYTPMPDCAPFPALTHRLNPRHYAALIDFAADLGITRCYVQSADAATPDFIPPFNSEGVARP